MKIQIVGQMFVVNSKSASSAAKAAAMKTSAGHKKVLKVHLVDEESGEEFTLTGPLTLFKTGTLGARFALKADNCEIVEVQAVDKDAVKADAKSAAVAALEAALLAE